MALSIWASFIPALNIANVGWICDCRWPRVWYGCVCKVKASTPRVEVIGSPISGLASAIGNVWRWIGTVVIRLVENRVYLKLSFCKRCPSVNDLASSKLGKTGEPHLYFREVESVQEKTYIIFLDDVGLWDQ